MQLGFPLQGGYLWATETDGLQPPLKSWSLRGDSWHRNLCYFVHGYPLFFPLSICFPLFLFCFVSQLEVHKTEGMRQLQV